MAMTRGEPSVCTFDEKMGRDGKERKHRTKAQTNRDCSIGADPSHYSGLREGTRGKDQERHQMRVLKNIGRSPVGQVSQKGWGKGSLGLGEREAQSSLRCRRERDRIGSGG